jgi:acetyl-CoA carboxylase/biotin carboxylase 1
MGKLRGGSWVVVDPTINEEKMEMYADPDSRVVLSLNRLVSPKSSSAFLTSSRSSTASTPPLAAVDSELETCEKEGDNMKVIREQNQRAREDQLQPVYLQAATEFAYLHDQTGRTKAKGVIKKAVPWEKSRKFFFWRATRRYGRRRRCRTDAFR